MIHVRLYEKALVNALLGFEKLSFEVEQMSWRAFGGCAVAKIKATGDQAQLWNLLTALRAGVEITDEKDDPVWWGYIEQVLVQDGKVSVGASLEKMANRIRCTYSEVNTAGTVGERAETAWVEDASSQAEYGVKELVVNLSEGTAEQALAKANMALAARSAPPGSIKFGKVSQASATITCAGWWKTLGWQFYAQSAGKEAYEDIVTGIQAFGDTSTRQKLAQSFQLASAVSWDAKTVRLRMKKEGTPTDTLTVKLCSDTAGAPGTVLVSGTLTGADIDENLNWVEFAMSARQTLVASTTYWITIERSGAASTANYYKCDANEALGYTRGLFRIYNGSWVARSPDADLLFAVAGVQETSQQIEDIIDAESEFITSLITEIAAAVYSSPYRDGDRTALECAEELLETGTSSNFRMLTEVKRSRIVALWEEPDIGDNDYMLRSDGRMYTSMGQEIDPYHYPVGVWAQLVDVTPASVNLSGLTGLRSIFIEEVIVGKDGMPQIRARDEARLLEIE